MQKLVGQYIGDIKYEFVGSLLLSIDRDQPHMGQLGFENLGMIADAKLSFTYAQDLSSCNFQSVNQIRVWRKPNATDLIEPKNFWGSINFNDQNITGTWETDIRTSGSFTLSSIESEQVIDADIICNSWDEYRRYCNEFRKKNDSWHSFRGQSNHEWALNSSFHRTGRRVIERYTDQDLEEFCNQLEARDIHFDRASPKSNSALMGFAQHYGFPTPLIDFTKSPYIAAYFAFCEVLERASFKNDSFVRVFALTEAFQELSLGIQLDRFDDPRALVLPFLPPAHKNERLVIQQGNFLFSTVARADLYMRRLEKQHGKRFLEIVDMPASIAKEAVGDLLYMGIGHATLFPGIDGLSAQLRKERFYLR